MIGSELGSFKQLERSLLETEELLGLKLGIRHRIRRELVDRARAGQLVEDELVMRWLQLHAEYLGSIRDGSRHHDDLHWIPLVDLDCGCQVRGDVHVEGNLKGSAAPIQVVRFTNFCIRHVFEAVTSNNRHKVDGRTEPRHGAAWTGREALSPDRARSLGAMVLAQRSADDQRGVALLVRAHQRAGKGSR